MWGGILTTPVKVTSIPGKVVQAQSGRSHICAIDQDGICWVWGQNKKGELGLGDQVARNTPYPLVSLKGKAVKRVVVGKDFTIAFSKV